MSLSPPRIAILGMGGTIAMVPGLHKSLVPASSVEELVAEVPLIRDAADIEMFPVDNLDSTNIDQTHWVRLVERIEELYEDFDGFVVTHGTDTMAYTAGAIAISLGLQLGKPIVFTGSQLPLVALGNDARANLENAVMVTREAISRRICEVMIVFGSRVLRGTRALKVSERAFEAFESPSFPDLGEITATGVAFYPQIAQRKEGLLPKLSPRAMFDPNILTIDVVPGLQTSLIAPILSTDKQPECRALILRALGAGNVPEKLLSLIELALSTNIPVFIMTRFGGRALPTIYEAGRRAIELGATGTGDLTDVMVQVKLMWLLGQGIGDAGGLKEELLKDYVGEVTGVSQKDYEPTAPAATNPASPA